MDYKSALRLERYGFVVRIGPDSNPNYFTGIGYSAFLAEAKVFRSVPGAMAASRIWQTADYGHPIPDEGFQNRQVVPVGLRVL